MNVLRKGMNVVTTMVLLGLVLVSNTVHAATTTMAAATSSGLDAGILGAAGGAGGGVNEIVAVVEKFRETIFLPLVILLLGISLAIMMYRRITGAAGGGR